MMSRSEKNIFEVVRKEILSFLTNSKKIFIGYSGGLDSHVLLHLLARICQEQPKLELTAIHINHNLSLNAKKWTNHCKKICKDLKVGFIVKNVNAKIKIKDHSPEEIARKLRYDTFAKILPKNALLLTAHQANDQAETLLLQLFRGAGPKGLAAMPKKIQFAKGWLLRPLLNFSREELLQYAKEYKLKWIEDESNTDIKFDRNFIRHRLMPLIKKKWPGIITTLNRVANHSAEAAELLDSLAAYDLTKVTTKIENAINIKKLKILSPIRVRNLLRFWLHTLKLPTPDTAKLNEVMRTVINSRSDATPLVKWHGAEIRRFQDFLYAMKPLLPHDNKIILRFDLRKPIKLPGDLGILRVEKSKKFKIGDKKFTVRFRQGGEEIKMPKRKGTHKLKKLMQEWQIPPWLRDRIPLVYCEKEIIAVVGYYGADLSVAVGGSRKLVDAGFSLRIEGNAGGSRKL